MVYLTGAVEDWLVQFFHFEKYFFWNQPRISPVSLDHFSLGPFVLLVFMMVNSSSISEATLSSLSSGSVGPISVPVSIDVNLLSDGC